MTSFSIARAVSASVVLALVLAGCSGAEAPSANPSTPVGLGGTTLATPSSDNPEPTTTPETTASGGKVTPSENQGDPDWRSVKLPPTGDAEMWPWELTDGFDGGLLALMATQDPRDDEYTDTRLVVWSVRADGTLDDRFAGDGSRTLLIAHPYEQVDIGGFVRSPIDDSVLIQASVADSGSDQATTTYRITRDGEIDESYSKRHTPLEDSSDEDIFAMTAIVDGSVRFCRVMDRDAGISLWGLDPSGNEDKRLGPEGRRDITSDTLCGGVAAHPDGDAVIGVQQTESWPRCSGRSNSQIELMKVDAHGQPRAGWGGKRLPLIPESAGDTATEYSIKKIAVAEDGSTLVAGLVSNSEICGQGRGSNKMFLARARASDGSWDPNFGDGGMIFFSSGVQQVESLDVQGSVAAIAISRVNDQEDRNPHSLLFAIDTNTGKELRPRHEVPRDNVVRGIEVLNDAIAMLQMGGITRIPISK